MTEGAEDHLPGDHLKACVRHDKVLAILSLIFSVGVAFGCWREIGAPFPGPSEPFMVRLGLIGGTIAFIYLFASIECVYERMWLGLALFDFALSAIESFRPGVVAPLITELRVASLLIWLAATALSLSFTRSALTRN